jgi:hypothetical protein
MAVPIEERLISSMGQCREDSMEYRLTFSEEHPVLVITALSVVFLFGAVTITLASVGWF